MKNRYPRLWACGSSWSSGSVPVSDCPRKVDDGTDRKFGKRWLQTSLGLVVETMWAIKSSVESSWRFDDAFDVVSAITEQISSNVACNVRILCWVGYHPGSLSPGHMLKFSWAIKLSVIALQKWLQKWHYSTATFSKTTLHYATYQRSLLESYWIVWYVDTSFEYLFENFWNDRHLPAGKFAFSMSATPPLRFSLLNSRCFLSLLVSQNKWWPRTQLHMYYRIIFRAIGKIHSRRALPQIRTGSYAFNWYLAQRMSFKGDVWPNMCFQNHTIK